MFAESLERERERERVQHIKGLTDRAGCVEKSRMRDKHTEDRYLPPFFLSISFCAWDGTNTVHFKN